MKAKEYALMQRCIEEGIQRGHTRAYKHTETPLKTHIENEIYEAIMAELCEWFDWEAE